MVFIYLLLGDHHDPHREIVEIGRYPWSSIGKVGNSSGGVCTATVIAPDQFLTAAHCLINAGRFVSSDSIHILLGYAHGRYRTHRSATRYFVPPTFDPSRYAAEPTALQADDWAVLYTDEPFPPEVKPLRMASVAPSPGTEVKTAGYDRERMHAMTADHHCQIVSTAPDQKLMAHDCVVWPGDSGAPLLGVDDNLESLVLGINVAGPKYLETAISWGVAISAASIAEFLATRVSGTMKQREMRQIAGSPAKVGLLRP